MPLGNIFFGPFATWLPIVVVWAVFLWGGVLYVFRAREAVHERLRRRFSWRWSAGFLIFFKFAYAAFLSFGQYYIWSQDSFTRAFLHAPLDPELPIGLLSAFPWLFSSSIGYFLFYSWGRFWMNAALAVGVALLWWWFLRALARRNERFFEKGEPDIGFLMALLVGWPNVVVFVPLVFLAVVLVSVVRRLFLKQAYTTLGWSFLVAGFITLVFGSMLASMLGLTVLRI